MARANALVFVDVPAWNATVPTSFIVGGWQATEVTTWSAVQPENRILTGDMNAWPDQSSITHINKTYYDSWTVAANQGATTTLSGNDGQTKSGRSQNLSVKSSPVYDTRDDNGVMPSDHRPVLTTFIVK